MRWFEKTLTTTENVLHVIGCSALVLIGVLINADIISRLLFQEPVQFQFELVEFYLMPAVAALPLSKVFRDGGHLALDLVTPQMFGRWWPLARGLMLALAGLFFLAIAVMSGLYAGQAFMKDQVYFGVVDWPLGWAYLSVPVGAAVLTTRLLWDMTKKNAK